MIGAMLFAGISMYVWIQPTRNSRLKSTKPQVAQPRNPLRVFQFLIGISGFLLFGFGLRAVVIAIAAGVAGYIVPLLNERELITQQQLSIAQCCSIVDHLRMCLAAGTSVPQAIEIVAHINNEIEPLQLLARHMRTNPIEALRTFGNQQPQLLNAAHLLERSFVTGAPLRSGLSTLSEHMRNSANQEITRRVRAVAVKSVLPLGLCFLPSFVLLTVVPLAVGLFSQTRW